MTGMEKRRKANDHAPKSAGRGSLHDGTMAAATRLVEQSPGGKRVDEHGRALLESDAFAQGNAELRGCHGVFRPHAAGNVGRRRGASYLPVAQETRHGAAARFDDGAAALEAGDGGSWLLECVEAAYEEKVGRINGGSEDPDENFSGARMRDRDLHDGQAFGFAVVSADVDSAHGGGRRGH